MVSHSHQSRRISVPDSFDYGPDLSLEPVNQFSVGLHKSPIGLDISDHRLLCGKRWQRNCYSRHLLIRLALDANLNVWLC